MKITYEYNSKIFWQANWQYLLTKKLIDIVVLFCIFLTGVFWLLIDHHALFPWLFFLPLIFFLLITINYVQQAKEIRRYPNRIFDVEQTDNELICITDDFTTKIKWSSITKVFLLKDFIFLKQKGFLQYMFIPRISEDFENSLLGKLEEYGIQTPSKINKKYLKSIILRNTTIAMVVLSLLLFVYYYMYTQFHLLELKTAFTASHTMEDIIRYRLGIKASVHPNFNITIGKSPVRSIVVELKSNSILANFDTTKNERLILPIIDSLITFSPDAYIFKYKTLINKTDSRSICRYYEPDKVKEIVGNKTNSVK